MNYRPEYSSQWNNKTYYMQLSLDPLGRENAEEILTALVGGDAATEPLRQLIIDKTEGNPFYMEETVQLLLDEGALLRNGTIKLARPLAELKIPPTVQAILASIVVSFAHDVGLRRPRPERRDRHDHRGQQQAGATEPSAARRSDQLDHLRSAHAPISLSRPRKATSTNP